MQKIPYKSLATPTCSGEFIISKSRFIGDLFLVHDINEVQDKLSFIQQKHREATHIAYAYILNEDVLKEKSSDNGEPSGTAGAPILNALHKNNLMNILACVTRYFGGIKLGAGGLIRAYGKGVTVALDNASLANYDLFCIGSLEINYSDLKPLQLFLKERSLPILNEDFTDKVKVSIQIKKDQIAQVEGSIVERFQDRYHLEIIKELILPELISKS